MLDKDYLFSLANELSSEHDLGGIFICATPNDENEPHSCVVLAPKAASVRRIIRITLRTLAAIIQQSASDPNKVVEQIIDYFRDQCYNTQRGQSPENDINIH